MNGNGRIRIAWVIATAPTSIERELRALAGSE
jgi:hypothetical protein